MPGILRKHDFMHRPGLAVALRAADGLKQLRPHVFRKFQERIGCANVFETDVRRKIRYAESLADSFEDVRSWKWIDGHVFGHEPFHVLDHADTGTHFAHANVAQRHVPDRKPRIAMQAVYFVRLHAHNTGNPQA